VAGRSWLITGGAGFLGINLVRALLARGERVTTLDLLEFDYPERGQVRALRGDIRERTAVDAALQGIDIVAHCAAALPLYSRADIFSTEVAGTRTVIAATRAAGVARLIHISTTAVYSMDAQHPLREDTALAGMGAYGTAKIEAEQHCLQARGEGFCLPVLRPKSFIGPERLGVFALLYDWASEGRNFPVPGRGHNRYQYLDVDDLCEAIWLCATLPAERVNATFNIGAARFGTFREDFQAVLDHAGHGKRVIPLPVAPALWALRALDRLGLSPLYPWVYETAVRDSFVSIEKAQRALGWQPRYSNREAPLRHSDWYVANRARFAAASGVTHRVPWQQGALALAKHFF